MPVAELRAGEAVAMGGKAVGEAEGAVLGELLKANGALTSLDLSGSACAAAALERIGEGLGGSAAPLVEQHGLDGLGGIGGHAAQLIVG